MLPIKPLLLTLLLLLPVAAHPLPDSFEASYTLSTKGMVLGETRYRMEPSPPLGESRFHFTTHTQPTGLAALMIDKVIDESSTWGWHNNILQPERYHYQQRGKREREREHIFDWQKQRVSLQEEGVTTVLEGLQPGTVDKAMFLLTLMHDLEQGKELLRYPLAKPGQWTHYLFKRGDHATIEVAAGRFEVQLITRETTGKRSFRLWMAPALHYLPIQIEYTEKDGKRFLLQLKQTTLQD
ncbi:MAG: DUF3108 domain-containing protein [Gammaproteobacteria bacterium]|jgi:hypothetical protein|nr:DUF3108 domain-containing protein [Gammaproteobacteria bacterium]MBT7307625.1 DUF3108 domain-containing protein [Gammaproteobacteria bacterium]